MWRKRLPSALPAPQQGAALRQKAPHKSQSPCPVLCPIRPNFFSTFKTLWGRIILLIYHSDEGGEEKKRIKQEDPTKQSLWYTISSEETDGNRVNFRVNSIDGYVSRCVSVISEEAVPRKVTCISVHWEKWKKNSHEICRTFCTAGMKNFTWYPLKLIMASLKSFKEFCAVAPINTCQLM